MTNPFEDLGLGELWDQLAPKINEALDDGHYLQDTPEVRARLADADRLARRLEDE